MRTACLLLLVCLVSGSRQGAPKRDLRDVLGVTHVAGAYHLTDKDFLNEGAEKVVALGSRVIKLYLANPRKNYPFNSDWPRFSSLAEMAQSTYYRAVFQKPFTTYILTTYRPGVREDYWLRGITDEEKAEEQKQFHDLTKHLLTAYKGTGKTFILQHWEGDWAVRGGFDAKADPTPTAIEGMIGWLNARQAGVEAARMEVGEQGAHVYHAAEVNLVLPSMRDGRPGVVNRVLPKMRLDLVSYSSWESEQDPALFRKALDYIAEQMPDSKAFGAKNVYVGEFGLPENEYPLEKVQSTVRGLVDVSLEWGCPYVVYWQLYCNEPKRKPVVKNEDVRGFWLIRPDGSKTWGWGYLKDRLNGRKG